MLPVELTTTRQSLGFHRLSDFAKHLGITSTRLRQFEKGYRMEGTRMVPVQVPLFLGYACGWLLLTGGKGAPWPPVEDQLELRDFCRKSPLNFTELGYCFGVSDRTLRKTVRSGKLPPAYFAFVICWLRLYGPLDPFPAQPVDGLDLREFESDY